MFTRIENHAITGVTKKDTIKHIYNNSSSYNLNWDLKHWSLYWKTSNM